MLHVVVGLLGETLGLFVFSVSSSSSCLLGRLPSGRVSRTAMYALLALSCPSTRQSSAPPLCRGRSAHRDHCTTADSNPPVSSVVPYQLPPTPSNEALRHEAEQMLVQFKKSEQPYALCKHILGLLGWSAVHASNAVHTTLREPPPHPAIAARRK